MNDCVRDANAAALDRSAGPPDPRDFAALSRRLPAARLKLAPVYRAAMFDPFTALIQDLQKAGFDEVLAQDKQDDGAGRLMMDLAHSLLQPADGFERSSLRAFQEVVADLYDGFLSAQDRVGVKKPDRSVLAPMVKFGEPETGPYTWSAEVTTEFGVEGQRPFLTGLVSLPPSNARKGLMAWSALSHETAGHDILGADTGLRAELAEAVERALVQARMGSLAEYWSDRIEETAADVMGILNMGPAAGIGLIAFFRGFGGALRNEGAPEDSHPVDILRGFLAASSVRLLMFADRNRWADVIRNETIRDLRTIRIPGRLITTRRQAERSAEIVANTIINTRMRSLENTALGQIQNWRDRDEAVTDRLRGHLRATGPIPVSLGSDAFAAHGVAGAVLAALSGELPVATAQQRMIEMLGVMHDQNQAFGPLFLTQRGNVFAHRCFADRKAVKMKE
ncbi:MAG: hypothetical protein FJW40_02925 [Acidobacteria bacterium]|nr:hypothetical protein [Acidobacteriota bacterium]